MSHRRPQKSRWASSSLQRFLPRSSKSIWSKINREKALLLIAGGGDETAGLEAIENAKKLDDAMHANPEATAFFKTLDRANRYADQDPDHCEIGSGSIEALWRLPAVWANPADSADRTTANQPADPPMIRRMK